MLKSKAYILTLAAIVILSVIGCKYKKGPLVSLRTPEERMTGDWEPEYLAVNGADRTEVVDSMNIGYYRFTYTRRIPVGSIAVRNMNDSLIGGGGWGFNFEQNQINIGVGVVSYTIGLPLFLINSSSDVESWSILKLNNQRMWLETEYNGINYFVKFKKIRDFRVDS